MPPPCPVFRLPVRHNQVLDLAGLREEAAEAFRASGLTQGELAERLESSQALVSRALKDETGRYASTHRRIIEAVTDYAVTDETTPTFRVVRKAA